MFSPGCSSLNTWQQEYVRELGWKGGRWGGSAGAGEEGREGGRWRGAIRAKVEGGREVEGSHSQAQEPAGAAAKHAGARRQLLGCINANTTGPAAVQTQQQAQGGGRRVAASRLLLPPQPQPGQQSMQS